MKQKPTNQKLSADPNFTETTAMLAETAAETEDSNRAAGGSVTEIAAGWIASQYLVAVRKELAAELDGPERFKLLRQAAGDVVALQRGGHSAARLQLDREKLEFARQKHKDAIAAAQPEVKKRRDFNAPLTDEERLAIVAKVDEIMGIKPWPPQKNPNAECRNPKEARRPKSENGRFGVRGGVLF